MRQTEPQTDRSDGRQGHPWRWGKNAKQRRETTPQEGVEEDAAEAAEEAEGTEEEAAA